jgi:hypothetical protein
MKAADRKMELWHEAVSKAHALDTWRGRAVPGEWPIIQKAANKILEDGIKRELHLYEVRMIKRRAAMKTKLLNERRENEEQLLAYRMENKNAKRI